MLLLLNVLLDDRKRRTADGAHEVRIGPERWQLLFQHRKLLPQHARGATFEQANQAMNPKLGVALNKQMHMVGHDFEAYDLGLMLTRRFADDVGKPSGNLIGEHTASVLRAPDHMVLTRVVYGMIGFVVRLCSGHGESIQR